MQPLHTDLPVRDAAEENPPLIVRVVSLLVLDEIIDHGVDLVRLELVPEFWILGFDRFPGVAVVFSGSVEADTSSACTGDPDLLHLLRQEQRQRRCLLDFTCSDGASLLPLVLASSPTWYQGSGRSPLGSSSLSDKRHAPDHRR